MMSKLKLTPDRNQDRLILGGLGVYSSNDDVMCLVKILGLYEGQAEVFDIQSKDLSIIKQSELTPIKMTIDGHEVAKESYRVFVTNINNDFDYIIKSYAVKPLAGTIIEITDIKILNSPIFNVLSNKEVTVKNYDNEHHNYRCTTSSGKEIYLRRDQFVIPNNNRVDIAFLKNLN